MKLQFPRDRAVGQAWWPNPEPISEWGHAPAIGEVEVPDDAQVQLSVDDVVAVAVAAIGPEPRGWKLSSGLPSGQRAARRFLRRRRAARQTSELVWELGNDSLRANLAFAGPASYSVAHGDVPVDLAFLHDLPEGAISDLDLPDEIVLSSLPAITHLAPGLRQLTMTVMDLDDTALALVARLHRLKSLQLYGGRFTGQGLNQLTGLGQLEMLHVEMDDLEPSWFAFAAEMPNLVTLAGPDETPDQPWNAAQVSELRRMLPGIQVC